MAENETIDLPLPTPARPAVRGAIVCFKSMGSGHRFAKIHQKAWGRDVWKEEEIGFTRF